MPTDEPPLPRAVPAITIALAAGVVGAIQPKINAELSARVGNAIVASTVNFTAALVAVVVSLALRPTTRRTLGRLPSWPVPRWTFVAGLGGAAVVIAGAVSVGTIGVAVFSVAFFAGQLSAGLLVDRVGVGAAGVLPFVAARVQAALLAIVAVGASQIGRPVGELAPGLVLFVVVAGGASAFQAACNGRIARSVGDAFAATALNVAVGLAALVTIVAGLAATGGLPTLAWPAQPWLYSGGFLGVSIVLSLAIATAAVGVLRTTVAMLAAQLLTALVVDWAVQHRPPTAGVVAGAALIVVAVAVVAKPAQQQPQEAT